jgi:hypothetical protein
MRAINHAMTGAIIGLVIGEPLAAIPVAFLSHYIMDVIPHHGEGEMGEKQKLEWIRSKLFRNLIYADALLCGLLVLVLAISQPAHWLLAAVCAFAAASPDLLSFNRYQKTLSKKGWKAGWYTKFAGNIQWFERPIGGFVELAWFIAAVIILLPILR